jgi:hypothetical protein
MYLWDCEANSCPPTAGNEGFIADLELASVALPANELLAVPYTPDAPDKPTQAGPCIIPIPSNNPPWSPPPPPPT